LSDSDLSSRHLKGRDLDWVNRAFVNSLIPSHQEVTTTHADPLDVMLFVESYDLSLIGRAITVIISVITDLIRSDTWLSVTD
jgi:hypothetical protein